MELFHSQGRTPEQSDELKMMERGSEIDKAVDLSIVAEMASGPVEIERDIQGQEGQGGSETISKGTTLCITLKNSSLKISQEASVLSGRRMDVQGMEDSRELAREKSALSYNQTLRKEQEVEEFRLNGKSRRMELWSELDTGGRIEQVACISEGTNTRSTKAQKCISLGVRVWHSNDISNNSSTKDSGCSVAGTARRQWVWSGEGVLAEELEEVRKRDELGEKGGMTEERQE